MTGRVNLLGVSAGEEVRKFIQSTFACIDQSPEEEARLVVINRQVQGEQGGIYMLINPRSGFPVGHRCSDRKNHKQYANLNAVTGHGG